MKTWIFRFIILLLAGCTEDEAIRTDTVINTVQNGTWRITYFNDSGSDETNHFTGYNFTFDVSGAVSATNGTNTYTGTWSVATSSSGKVKFNLGFAAPPAFEELTEDWEVISRTASKIELKHVSGGGGGTDFLTFQKN